MHLFWLFKLNIDEESVFILVIQGVSRPAYTTNRSETTYTLFREINLCELQENP